MKDILNNYSFKRIEFNTNTQECKEIEYGQIWLNYKEAHRLLKWYADIYYKALIKQCSDVRIIPDVNGIKVTAGEYIYIFVNKVIG